MFRRIVSFSLAIAALPLYLSLSPPGCVTTFDVAGGPQHASRNLRPDHIGDDLRPLVADEPTALARLDEVQAHERVSRVALWTGFGLLGTCLAVSMASTNTLMSTGSGGSDGTLYALIGLCGASIVADAVSIGYAPTKSTWGSVLRTYNQQRPQTPWTSAALDVAP